MNANFFAMGQAQVAQAITEKPALYQGANAGSIKRTATMAMVGALAALSFGMAPGEASAQMTPQQFQQDLQRRQVVQEQNLVRNAQQQQFNRQNNQQNFDFQRQYRKDAQKAQNKQMVTNLVTSAVVGGLTATVVGAVQGAMQPQRVQVVQQQPQQFYGQQPQQYYGQAQPQVQQRQAQFYSPRDMDMPERFTRVSQRANIGMAAPGPNTLDLRDGTQTSQNMVRALDTLNSSVEQAQRAQRQLDDMRLSNYQVSGQQQQQVNGAMQATNNNLDRAIETYIRMSNNAALEGKNTQGFNMLAAKMVNEGLAPEQQIQMGVNARANYGYQR